MSYQSFIIVWTLHACRFGGWDGKKWLSDVYILDTSTVFDSNTRLFTLLFLSENNLSITGGIILNSDS